MTFLEHLRAAAKTATAGTPLLLDGGLGTHLEQRGHDISGALWSAQILEDKPAEVRAAHADFFAAGAQIATTCSYQVTFEGCGQRTQDLLECSVRLAREAARQAEEATGEPHWVAASIGPYGAGPGEGTEYDGAYRKSARELARWHAPRAEILAGTGPDLLLAETIPSLIEAEALARVLSDMPGTTPVAVSFTVSGGRLRDGSSLLDATRLVEQIPTLCAVGVNCCSAGQARQALNLLAQETTVPLLAYPNSGERWDAAARRWVSAPQESPLALIDAPVALLGGCCRVGPGEIARLAQQRDSR
ncbi:homocysteine S-methyltransferase [Corynebacterium lowii]|uniref:Homocysteine S-methyltransferase n=1 Tax=Corynebacterium lowii TaxID=1544413 RepID=A0A0Q0U685_9CORY|nr:homocysteine S-methyltransferase [Corynebacterium lowii]KQB87573.1 Homocysteine S-methyltransferase [Corynebacterium lowii]MDP9851832.1 homocysteine S-methyltransferase [Corynebacterium lowii]